MPPLTNGCNHVALVTEDMDRFIAFYAGIFEADTLVDLREGPIRHALLDLGSGFCLHPFEFAEEGPHARASDRMFNRGHLDHLALNVTDEAVFQRLRARLVDAGATDGELIDFGSLRTVWFEDPDGMGGEIAIWSGGPARTLAEAGREAYAAAVLG